MPSSHFYPYKNQQLPHLLFDGLETESLQEHHVQCPQCNKYMELDIKKALSNNSIIRLRCKNRHFYSATINYYEKQPGRYLVELIRLERLKLKYLAIVILAVALFVGLIVWMHVSVIQAVAERNRLTENGVGTTALVIDSYHSSGPRQADRYELTYEYDVDGQLYNVTKQVDATTFSIYERGDTLPIVYDAADRETSDVLLNDNNATQIILLAITDTLLVAAGAYVFVQAKRETNN